MPYPLKEAPYPQDTLNDIRLSSYPPVVLNDANLYQGFVLVEEDCPT